MYDTIFFIDTHIINLIQIMMFKSYITRAWFMASHNKLHGYMFENTHKHNNVADIDDVRVYICVNNSSPLKTHH